MNKYLLVLSVLGMGVASISSAIETTTIKRSTSPAPIYSNNSSISSNSKAELASLTSSVESESFYNIKRRAEQGNADAQSNLGVMYDKGKGVRQNNIQAKEWYGKSCDNGDQDGCDAYRHLN